jgi:hypothetical protein
VSRPRSWGMKDPTFSHAAFLSFASVALFASSAAVSAQSELCEPSAQIQQEVTKASSATAEKATFEEFIAPFRALRERLPHDLFVHARYQDAVNERGVEGHLKSLTEEYRVLQIAQRDDLLYQYLYGRTLEGRSTKQAIAAMESVLASDPNFAPAHRTLAEIYGSVAFRDQQKESAERAKFEQLCPGSPIAHRLPPPPGKSALWSQAETLLKKAQSDERVPHLVKQALQQDEWRLQRIRPYDWYTPSYKTEITQEVQIEYWKAWRLLMQHFWKTNQTKQANELFSQMQDGLSRLQKEPASEVYWAAATTLVNLYAQAEQPARVRETLAMMQSSLKAKPDAKRAAQLARLKAKFLSSG